MKLLWMVLIVGVSFFRVNDLLPAPFGAYYPTEHIPDPANGGHVSALVATLLDKDHFTQQWTWRESGKENRWEVFKLTRRK